MRARGASNGAVDLNYSSNVIKESTAVTDFPSGGCSPAPVTQ